MDERVLFEKIRVPVEEGDADGARALAQETVDAGLDPLLVLEKGFTAALQKVGARWEAGELYLPEMILAAEAMKSALAVLQPKIRARGGSPGPTARCVLGTVKGDIHDIGKSIVGSLLEATGFQVLDLGTDVEPARFVSAVREMNANFVGMSALLTTTMPEMRSVIRALEEGGLRPRVRILIGGAPVTEEYAEEIGADGYAEDGLGAMRLFQKFAVGAAEPGALD